MNNKIIINKLYKKIKNSIWFVFFEYFYSINVDNNVIWGYVLLFLIIKIEKIYIC